MKPRIWNYNTEVKKHANKSKNEGWSSRRGQTGGEIKAKQKDSASKIQGGEKKALKDLQRQRRRVKNQADKLLFIHFPSLSLVENIRKNKTGQKR